MSVKSQENGGGMETAAHDAYYNGSEYLRLAFNSLSPARLKLSLNLAGHQGPKLGSDFSYAELGAGFGVSVAGWAAQYPQASFYSIDYNAAQAAWSRDLAVRAGLGNLHVHGTSIRETLRLGLPEFDFIVAHGLYSWVGEDVRADIRTFIKEHLKPGGCVYISYNAMPGFKDFEPMRRLIMQEVRSHGNEDSMRGLRAGLNLLNKLKELEAPYFAASPQAGLRLEQWLKDKPEYLAAELLARSHKAYHVNEMAAEFEGLRWAAHAGVVDHLAAEAEPPSLRALMEGKTPLEAETVRDFFHNTIFRTDLFVDASGRQHATSPDLPSFARNELWETPFSLGVTHKPLPESASRHNFSATLKKPIYALLQSALSVAPQTLGSLSEMVKTPRQEILQALCVLTALEWVQPGPPQCGHDRTTIKERVRAFNDALSGQCDRDELLPILSARGGWVEPATQIEHLVILAKLKGRPVEEYLHSILYADEPEMTAGEHAAFRESVTKYLEGAEKEIALFLKRHGLD